MTHVALTIAGSDPSGGAGLQADLKTFHAFGVYGSSVITLLTVQNTVSVSRVELVDEALVRAQLEAVLSDLPVRAAKTGALGSAAIVRAIAERFATETIPLVVDPVMISKHGALLVAEDAMVAMREELLPRSALVTPNAPEAEALSGRRVRSVEDACEAAKAIADLGVNAVLVKGGHLEEPRARDVLLVEGDLHILDGERIATRAGHGTGCTLSAAIAAGLANGRPLLDAVSSAKGWLTEALAHAPPIGRGVVAVNHLVSTARFR